ncbi:fumarylacetoacetate hydrolase family protein [Sphaerotilus microaerophilus]|uniref:5-carboxymethyl-2-hydroxymuconate isomerase n=1 Tax=Sphaerotilus microaerophilus TaxID=2914710 RepID=A0ABN6PQT5_9BURK|nr:fumarylacetoacetate hydrolase family protein [Sphaerotilus sp. FB-5]BDI05625.1 5-carboxymethyl-2-hydroxymuconate isomerase [Sphaerotilus sp. FB-5]
MKLVSYERNGQASFGAVVGEDGVVDLREALGGRYADLQALLAADALGEAAAAVQGRAAEFHLGDVTLLPVIPRPGKIWCCGLNYGEHVRETNREVTEQPTFFLRVADSQVGHDQAIIAPPESTQVDYEAEIAVVIGKAGRRIQEADVAGYIAGYACYNDGSIRDWQKHTSQWVPGKNFWRTGGFGPWMVTADEIPFGTVMRLQTVLNGQVLQDATTEMMIHSIARQIAYVSTIAPLQPGDVIVTGTPGGVGARRSPPVWMKPGDVCEIVVDKIGTLRNPIAAEG